MNDEGLLTEKDVDQNPSIQGVKIADCGCLVSPIYLLRLTKQSGILALQDAKSRADERKRIAKEIRKKRNPYDVNEDHQYYVGYEHCRKGSLWFTDHPKILGYSANSEERANGHTK